MVELSFTCSKHFVCSSQQQMGLIDFLSCSASQVTYTQNRLMKIQIGLKKLKKNASLGGILYRQKNLGQCALDDFNQSLVRCRSVVLISEQNEPKTQIWCVKVTRELRFDSYHVLWHTISLSLSLSSASPGPSSGLPTYCYLYIFKDSCFGKSYLLGLNELAPSKAKGLLLSHQITSSLVSVVF